MSIAYHSTVIMININGHICTHLIVLITDIGACGGMVMGKTCSENALCYLSGNDRFIQNCSCKAGYIGSGFICQGVFSYYVCYKVLYILLWS